MEHSPLLFSMFLIFTGAALFATVALYTRQSLLVAYILLGWVLGPYGLVWINDPSVLSQISKIGIIFLLFLLGLNLHPQNLAHMFKSAITVTVLSALCFSAVGFIVAYCFGFSLLDSALIGAAMIFSSTILGLKLLPTTVLHHQRMGEVVISILLLQDLIAIIFLLLLNVDPGEGQVWAALGMVLIALPGLSILCLFCERYILVPLIAKFDTIQEYIFLLAIGWCLGIAALAHAIGLSSEIGAFIAGVSLATSPIALYISESLKPLRDFFLILFFFSLGAGFNTAILPSIWMPTLVIAVLMLALKPWLFAKLLQKTQETKERALEIGVRLGQISEFSLLVVFAATEASHISSEAAYLIQATTLLTFIFSSYYIVMKYPTPISITDSLRRD